MRQPKLRIWHFVISALIFLAVLVGQWWIKPGFGHFIVMFCTVLIMCFGVMDGLIGFVFMRWEIRALSGIRQRDGTCPTSIHVTGE